MNAIHFIVAAALAGCSFVGDIANPPKVKEYNDRSIQSDVFETDGSPMEPVREKTTEVLPSQLIKGRDFQVRDPVFADGFNYFFSVKTDYGDFDAYGMPELEDRISELDGVRHLFKESFIGKMAGSAMESVTSPVLAAGHLLLNPVSSVEKVPETAMRFYNKAAETVSRVGTRANASYTEVTREDMTEEEKDELIDKYSGRASRFASNYADDYIRYSSSKRKIAEQVGLDPYSRNPVVQAQLMRLARASVASRVGLLVAPIPRVPGVGYAAQVDSLIWHQSEELLVKDSYLSLLSTGASEDSIEKLLSNPAFTRSQTVHFQLMLSDLEGVKGLPLLTAYAAGIETESGADFTLEALELLVNYHKNEHKLVEINTEYLVPAGLTADGIFVLPAPFDNLMAVPPVTRFIRKISIGVEEDPRVKSVLVLHTGKIAPEVQAEFKRLKWSMKHEEIQSS